MTRIQRVIFNAGAFMPRPTPRRAIMPISVTVEGDTSALVPDICTEIANTYTWAVYGETIIPADAAPRGVITASSGEHVFGGFLISLDPNQPAPEYVESNAKPDVSEVRLIITQPVTTDLSDLGLFLSRRDALSRTLSVMNGEIGGPAQFTPIEPAQPVIPTPPPAVDLLLYGISADQVPTAADLTIQAPNGVGTIPAYGTSRHWFIARLSNESDITSVHVAGSMFNQVYAFSKYVSTLTVGGDDYNVWVSNQALTNPTDLVMTVA